jgi:hypothetical protein
MRRRRECRASSISSRRTSRGCFAFNEYANEEGTEVAVVQIHPEVVEMLRHQAGAGVPLSVKPIHLGGFVRL